MSRQRPTQAVILAGGRGTRLRPLTDTVPKPMIPFHGKPFLGYVAEMLREQGFERLLLLLGYLPEVVMDHFGDGSAYGLEVEYAVTAPDDLTAYRVQEAADLIDDTFLLLYCDNYWPMRFDRMWESYLESGAAGQITVYGNGDGYTRDSVIVGEDGFVEVFDRGRTTPGLKGVEISYAILDKSAVMPLLPEHQELFEQAVYPVLTERRGRLEGVADLQPAGNRARIDDRAGPGGDPCAHARRGAGGGRPHRRHLLLPARLGRGVSLQKARAGAAVPGPARASAGSHADDLRRRRRA